MKYLPLITFLLGIIPGFGCSNEPGDLGLGLVSPQDTVRLQAYETRATSDTTFLHRISGTTSTLVGKYLDPVSNASIEAKALIQYSGFTSIPSNAVIDTAVLTLTANYKFRDTTGSVRFFVHEMKQSWSERTFTWDSLVSSSYNSAPDTSFDQNIDGDGSVGIHVEPLVRRWVKDSLNTPDGILLNPPIDPARPTDIIIGTSSGLAGSVRQLLTIAYHTPGDTIKTIKLYSIQNAFIANSSAPSFPNSFFSEAGIGYRGLLRFDSLSIPKRASVTRATLELSFDTLHSMTNNLRNDSLIVYLSRKNFLPYDSLVLATLCSPHMSGSQKVYRADIKAIVQQWIIREPNYGLIVRPYGEFSSLDRFSIHGSSAAINLRPKLSIIYTVLP